MMEDSTYPFVNSRTIQLDMYDCILGKPIGRGMTRFAYQHRTDSSLVVKVEFEGGAFQNIRESELWNEVKETKFKKWFAPVVYVSNCGSVILQKKCEPLDRKKYPKKIPTFFTDTKYGNYGLFEGKLVCFDYGAFPIMTNWKETMKKADWWEE